MPPLELNRVYHAFTCRCPTGVLWLEHPRHMTCTRCGALIEPIELVDRRAADYYKHDRDEARRAPDRKR
jgi:hypothetical protein